jgi:putative ABC transport system substrate-binding protein
LSAFAAELAALNPDVIVAPNGVATAAAARATAAAKREIPIVFAAWSDPVASGLAKSLAHPGGNVTGLSNTSVQLAGKQLQLLQTAFPKISRVAVFIDMATSTTAFFKEEVESAAKALRLQTLFLEMRSKAVFEKNIALIREWRADAIFVHNAPSNSFNRPLMVQIAEQTRLPAMYGNDLYTDIGGLMSYGSDDKLRWLQIATYVDKILRGARAGDLPIDLPTKFDFVINLKTARALGVTIPPSILARANKLIE